MRLQQWAEAGMVSQSEADELREFTRELKTEVLLWLGGNHPAIVPLTPPTILPSRLLRIPAMFSLIPTNGRSLA